MPDTKTSDETAAGALTGAELVRIVQSGNDRRTTAQAIADLGGGGGSGMFAGAMSAVPTSAGTGLTTWLNQGGASVADRATGISINAPTSGGGIQIRGRSKVVPATPYSVRALLSITSQPTQDTAIHFGWHDGTKLHPFTFGYLAATRYLGVIIQRYTNVTTFSANEAFTWPVTLSAPPFMWLRLKDDGTTVFFQKSVSGDDNDFIDLFSIAKASGFLGSGGYSNIFFGTNAANSQTIATLHSYSEGS